MKKFFKITAYVLAGFLAFLLLLAGLTQTKLFRDRLRAAALANLQSVLDADVRLGDLEGNLVTGFSIDSIAIAVQGNDVVRADRLEIRYNLFEIPGRRISIHDISIIRPVITLRRRPGERWNFAQMIRPAPQDTGKSGPFDWVIALNRFEIRDGTVTLEDSAALTDPGHGAVDTAAVEYHQVALEELNLVLSASVRRDEQRVSISSLSFLCQRPGFRLRRLSGEFLVSPSECRVDKLVVSTDRTDFTMDASMRDFNLFGDVSLERMRRDPVKLGLRAREMDLTELARFIPQINFLRGPVSVDLDASGEFGELNVRRLEMHRGRTDLSMKGTVYNLHDPGNLYLNLKLTESKISPADPVAMMPPFHLPDLSALGLTTLNLEFEGKPVDFHTKFLLETAAGNVHVDGTLKIGGPPTLTYDATAQFQNFDMALLTGDKRLRSALQGSVSIAGQGTNIGNLAGQLAVEFDSSEFSGQSVRNSRVSVEAADRTLTCTALVVVGQTSSALSAQLSEQPGVPAAFSVDGGVAGLNLRDFLLDEKYDCDLTMKLSAHGSGLTAATLGGDAVLDISNSRYKNYEISAGNIHLVLDQKDTLNKTFSLESNLADFLLTGAFDVQQLPQLVAFEAQNLRRALARKFSGIDSALATVVDTRRLDEIRQQLEARPARLNAQYSLHIKNLDPLSSVVGGGFTGSGLLQGSIAGGVDDLTFRGDLAVDAFSYGTAEAGVLVQRGKVKFDLSSLRPLRTVREMGIRLDVAADRINVNRKAFDSLDAGLVYNRERALYDGRVVFDRKYRFAVEGNAAVSDEAIDFGLRRLIAGIKDYIWSADPGTAVHLDAEGIRVTGLTMQRDSQVVAIEGSIGSGGALSGSLKARGVSLDGLRYVLTREEGSPPARAFDGVATVDATVGGTLAAPQFAATVAVDDMMYRAVPFGVLRGSLGYDGGVARVLLRMGRTAVDTAAYLTVTGDVPMDLRFSGREQALPEHAMSLTIRSDSLQMSILDPFVPTFQDLTGIMTSDVTMSGTPAEPLYAGVITIVQCRFLFVPNNISYTCDATFRPEGDRIRVVDAAIRNVPADEQAGRHGEVHLSGSFAFKDFTPGDFDLIARGELLVVKESTLKSSLSVYGNLYPVIGEGGLHFTGDLDHSLLKGSLSIRNSTLIFPPTRAVAGQQANYSVPVVVVDDTSHHEEFFSHSVAARYFGASRRQRSRAGAEEELQTRSFMDGVRYDLDIEAPGGSTEIRMEFNPATNEELEARLDGRFTITDDGTKWFGDLKVSSATYNFFKKFDATGSLRFTGDLMNPELNIDASYQGTRVIRNDSLGTETNELVVVGLKITGTRNEPKLDMSMTINSEDYYNYKGPGLISHDLQSDAISFIIGGNFPLTTAERNDVAANFRSTAGLSILSGATSLLTGQLSHFLREQTGFINDLQVSYDPSATIGGAVDIRLSGTVSKALWRYGGKIIDDPLSNANFSLLYSVGDIFDETSLRNLMFELERKVEPSTIGQLNELKRVNSARLFYRLAF